MLVRKASPAMALKALASCLTVALVFAAAITFMGCEGVNGKLTILSGSENQTIEPLVKEWASSRGVDVTVKYKGSVDIMLALQTEEPDFDAVWPANGLWIALGDEKRRLKHARSIMTSPVVFGVRKTLANDLGLTKGPVRVADLLALIQAKKLTFAMTSASQSNSGATAFLGFMMALRGGTEPLSSADLQKPGLRAQVTSFLSGVDRSSGSSGWLKDLFLAGNYDAMVNYEALIIETNQELIKKGKEPLVAIYPVDGISIADSPLAFLKRGTDDKSEENFKALQTWLLEDAQQQRILSLGRRTGLGGVVGAVDKAVFNPDWGIDVARILSPFPLPDAGVIREALTLYQTELRKPSLIVFCLDYSGSMSSNGGEEQLKQAMDLLLDSEKAGKFVLQAGSRDRFQFILFSNEIRDSRETNGGDTAAMKAAGDWIQTTRADGGTDIYRPVVMGLEWLRSFPDLSAWNPAIVLLTDGLSNGEKTYDDVQAAYEAFGADIPIYTIAFGDADEGQLKPMAALSRGRHFDGRGDIVTTMRAVRGYN